MAPRKKTETVAPSEAAALLAAVEFVAVCQADLGLPYQIHCVMRQKTIMATDGVLTIGCNTDFAEVETAPHTLRLVAALKRCKKEYSITQTDTRQLVVKAGAFRAVVPCMPIQDLAANVMPDNPIADINDNLKVGFQAIGHLLSDKTEHVVTSSVLLQAYTMAATDRILMTEFYHGINLPPGLVLPKVFVTAVAKSKKKLAKFGFSENSVTFWFEDYSWIRTQLHTEAWPDFTRIFNKPAPELVELPKKLAEGIESVASFSDDGIVYLNQNEVASHLDNAVGASFDCKDVPGGCAFGIKRIQSILPLVESVDWNYNENYVYFQGPTVRSCLGKRT